MPRVKENLLFNLVMDRLSQIYFLSANYVKVGYFRHLFLSSILATFFVLVIVYGTQIDLASPELVNTTSIIWKKTAFIGFWSTCASAAGILGMARYQGVLSAILSSPRGGSSAIIMLIAPPTVFGALAFPVAYLLTSLWFYQLVSINMLAIFYSIMIICVGFIMTIPIATIFLISRHAATYEILILIPLLVISGVLSVDYSYTPSTIQIFLMPNAFVIQAFMANTAVENLSVYSLLCFVLSLLLWCGIGIVLSKRLLRKSLKVGSLENM